MKWRASDKFTKMRRAILEAIARAEVCPSIRELGGVVDLSSSSTVHAHLESLVRNGYLKHEVSKPRAYAVTAKGYDALSIPVCEACGGTGRCR